MSHSMMEPPQAAGEAANQDPFELDIRVLESSDGAASLINLTDDNCGSSCPKACATNVG
ncbi:FxLD family lanthipeptide [Actinomadura algeriensis]|uniref:FxLD family lantipeptide n=1 Tax=Actinomadura algeriensis TaxID=1679523 RepID=A0ABR9JS73_9ACTN|nr:FxLD family lanthipeptide [Actinomadura algeriensis]MBE1533236.1 FxLD family lantipeptide [Actinomadura algeriensis]